MAVIDNKVVELSFNNAQFEKGVQSSIKSMGDLNSSMNLNGGKKSLSEVAGALKNIDASNAASSVDGLSAKFVALAATVATVASKITQELITLAKQSVRSITDGLGEYELQMNSVQTILSNTMAKGTTIADVNAALEELNRYADLTIYNFGEMTRNIGTFTAAGVDLKTATTSIKGLANVAAMSGSSSQQASTAMYQLSQALATGTVKLMDWKSVENAGMGGKLFQEALYESAKAAGTLTDVPMDKSFQKWESQGNSFRETLADGWLTADVLTKTLNAMSGDMDAAALSAAGYTDAQVKYFTDLAANGIAAATDVKTFTQLIGTLQEAAGTGWADTFKIVIGDFEEAKQLWTGVYKTFGGMLDAQSAQRNEILQGWKDLGGRERLISGLKNAFEALNRIVTPIKEAFETIFPPKTALDLLAITVKFDNFTKKLIMSKESMENLKSTFKGFFAIFDIIKTALTSLGKIISTVWSTIVSWLPKSNTGILEFSAGIGESIVKFSELIKNGERFAAFLKKLEAGLNKAKDKIVEWANSVKKFFVELANSIKKFFSDYGSDKSASQIESFKSAVSKLGDAADSMSEKFGAINKAVSGFWSKTKPHLEKIKNGFSSAFDKVKNSIDMPDISGADIIGGILAALTGGVLVSITAFFNTLKSTVGSGKGILDGVKDSIDQFGGVLKGFAAKVKAQAIKEIAIALALLAGSAFLLSLVDLPHLGASMGALTLGLAEMVAVMKILDKMDGTKMNKAGVSLLILGVGMMAMAGAIAILGNMDLETLGKGLGSFTVALGVFAAAVKVIPKKSVASAAASFLLLGIGLQAFGGAMLMFKAIDWIDIAKGMGTMAVGLISLTAAVKILGKNKAKLIQTAAAFLVLAVGLQAMAGAVLLFAQMSWSEIARGLVGVAASVAILVIAAKLIDNPKLASASAGMVLMAAAVAIMASAVKKFGSMDLKSLVTGILGAAAALGVLVLAASLSSGSVAGSASLAILASAVLLLSMALAALAALGIAGLATAVIGLAVALGVLIAAGALAIAVAPGLLILAAALAAIGLVLGAAAIAALAFALAATAFATVLAALAEHGSKAGEAVISIMDAIIKKLPELGTALGEMFINFINTILENGPVIINLVSLILQALIQAVRDNIDPFGEMVKELISKFLEIIREMSPEIVDTAIQLLLDMLHGIRDNIGEVVTTAIDIVVNFINGISSRLGSIIEAGANLLIAFIEGIGKQSLRIGQAAFNTIIAFVNGLADTIRTQTPRLMDAGANLASALIEGVANGIKQLGHRAWSAVTGWAGGLLDGAKNLLGINSPSKEFAKIAGYCVEGYAKQFDNDAPKAYRSVDVFGSKLLDALNNSTGDIEDYMSQEWEFNPKIRPSLDLTALRQDAWLVSDTIGVAVGWRDADRNSQNGSNVVAVQDPSQQKQEIVFNQYNTSPKTLSAFEIYKDTRSLIAQASAKVYGK